MAIQGLRDTSNFVADARPKNWREGILLQYPNGNIPLLGLTSLMKKRVVDDPEFNWWEKAMQTRRLALGANLTAVNTDVTLTAGALGLKDGDMLSVEEGGHSGEVMLVNGDPSSDTAVTVIRGYSGTTAAAVTYNGAGVNPNLTVIGSAYEEGSNAPTGIQFDPTKKYNYTQIFRNTLEATRTAMKTRLRTGDAVKEAKRECLEIHGVDMERAFWFGRRVETTRNGKPLRTLGGILNYIDSGNVVTAGATTDMETLEEYFYNIFKFGSNEKMAFCGNRSLLTIQQIIRKNSDFNIQTGLKEYGMNVMRLETPFGSLVLKNHPLFNQQTGGTTGTATYAGVESWMAVLDMSELTYVHLTDSDTKYQPDLQANDLDGMKSGYLSESSMETHFPLSHYLIKGLIGAAADT